jgi:predicted DNA-binding protein (MmcQ/YjbR family)
MTPKAFNAYCASLPHTFSVVQWGGALVWKVGDATANKVFAIGWFADTAKITFKTSPLSFDLLKDQAGCIPAPYLASRGMKWIQRTSDETLNTADLKKYLKESHRLAALTLSKKKQLELGLV